MDYTERSENLIRERETKTRGRVFRFFTPVRSAIIYLTGITLAEALTTLVEPRVGLVVHGLVLVALFLHASFDDQGRQRGFLLSLSIAPLIRLLSLSLPLPNFPFIYWYMVVGAPLMIAAFVAARIGRINLKMQGLTIRKLPVQILVALTGLLLGYFEYIILRPSPLISELTPEQLWLPALILLVFTGFLEEWIFRGLMQYTAMRSFGMAGFYYVAVVFAVLHLGYQSVLDVVFVLAVAIFFGWVAQRTGSIFGVTIAHGLTNIGLFLIFPFIVGQVQVIPTVTPQPGEVSPLPSSTPHIAAPSPIAPGLLAPIATVESTRPWLPATVTQSPSLTPTRTSTFTITVTDEPTPTVTQMPATNTPTPCGPPAGWVRYTVHIGDTLFSLSVRLGVSVVQLQQANCMQTDQIMAGQVLYVPFIPPTPPARATLTQTATEMVTAAPTVESTPTPQSLPTITNTTEPTNTHTPLPTDTPETPMPSETTAPTSTTLPTETTPPTETLAPSETPPPG